MKPTRPRSAVARRLAAHGGLLLLASGQTVLAAGGHHAVDDAAVLDNGQCQFETWLDHRAGGGRLLHLGPGCGWAGFEWGLNLDRWRAGAERGSDLGVSGKFARPWGEHCSLGGVAALGWSKAGEARRFAGGSLLLPVSCSLGSRSLHLNLGRDLRRGAPDAWRSGLALEQGLGASWQLMAEAWREPDARRWRTALRWSREAWTIDVGRQQPFGDRHASVWTLGVGLVFDTGPTR